MRIGRRLLLAILVACLAAVFVIPVVTTGTEPPPVPTTLDNGLAPLTTLFNDEAGHVRFVAILSPT